MVAMPQIFLPFVVGHGGRTLYEHVQTNPGFLGVSVGGWELAVLQA
jgi:hypothetical protein